MNERDFVARKRGTWDRLEALVKAANRRGGLSRLGRDELLSLGPLYRRVSSDLAYARTHTASADLVVHLNAVVGRAHALLYNASSGGRALRAVSDFYGFEFPTLLQRRAGYFLAAIAITAAGALFAYALVVAHPERIDLFVPEMLRSSVDVWKSGKVTAAPKAEMSGYLMTHNFQVGMLAASCGVAAMIPTVVLMFINGATLGALGALMTKYHRHATLWPGIVPHGVAELTAIFICGAAGLQLGAALLAPRRYSRGDAFRLAGSDAVRLVLGTIPLFIFAGIIEGMFSHLDISAAARYVFAAVTGIAWYLYLFLPRTARTASTDLARNARSAQRVEA